MANQLKIAMIARAVITVVCLGIGCVLLSDEFGWKIGVAIGALVYILIPYYPPPPMTYKGGER